MEKTTIEINGNGKVKDVTEKAYGRVANTVEATQAEGRMQTSLILRGTTDRALDVAAGIIDGTDEQGTVVLPAPAFLQAQGVTGLEIPKARFVATVLKHWGKALQRAYNDDMARAYLARNANPK